VVSSERFKIIPVHQSRDRPGLNAVVRNVNDGERYRHNETISTGFVESTVNQVVSKRFVKKQQMQWTPRGAHLLLQTRTKVLNGDLEQTFRGWYPAFRHDAEELAA
jgi:hypothetical protein